MGRSSNQKEGDSGSGSEDAAALRLKSTSPEVQLDLLGKSAATVLHSHQSEFEKGEHWYEYLIGAVAEGAKIYGITVPVGFVRMYAGFIEVFEWEDGVALESLYLLPQYRKRGYGTTVVKYLEDACDDRLTIWAGRVTAPFYERLGYTRDTTQGGFMMTKGGRPGKTFTQAASRLWP